MALPRTAPLAIISPVRDEAEYIRLTLESIVKQTVWPQEWLLVDDGSKDTTRSIIESYSAQYPWIRVVSRRDTGQRRVGAGVIAAFKDGLSQLNSSDYQFIAKLDGDMSFPPRYLEVMLDRLNSEPKLAAVSGKVFRPEPKGYVEEFILNEMVAGQFKLYKRSCYEAIGGFTETILWDGIDIQRCRMKGFTTASFYNDEAKLIHHRLMGSSDQNVLKGRQRLGRGIWFMGYHPLYALASGVFRMHEKPFIAGGLIIISSYFGAMLRREPRFNDAEFIKQLQRYQLQRLSRLPLVAFRKLLRR